MVLVSIIDLATILVSACFAAIAGLAILGLRRADGSAASAAPADTGGAHYLFHDCDLEHASDTDAARLAKEGADTDWDRLRLGLVDRFPDMPAADALPTAGTQSFLARDAHDPGVLHLTREREMLRVSVGEIDQADRRMAHMVKALQTENDLLRQVAHSAPYPVWAIDARGTVIWSNPAYAAVLSTVRRDSDPSQEPLFPVETLHRAAEKPVRAQVHTRQPGVDRWFNVGAEPWGDRLVCHAVDIDAVIQAEVAQRNFVQTLAKTFAQLSIGLAIFDRNGQLALFNPALVDLTALPAEFLSARPDLLSFFDRLRDNRVMPEPKNYVSWRQEIADVIAAASHGSYQETWSLDSGHTYRVSGRPHPDGAVAFLIEDITAEIALTRNFRAELELGQSMMDTFEDALAVFSPSGVMSFCNIAYRTMWKIDPDNSFADITVIDTLKLWQDQCHPNPAWGDVRDFVLKVGDRVPWDSIVEHDVLGSFRLQVSPIVSGATVVRFCSLPAISDAREKSRV